MKRVIFILSFFFSLQVFSQEKPNSWTAFLFNYTHQFPFADLKERFGDNSSIGTILIKKTNKNWIFGVDGAYLFGHKIKNNDLFDNIGTENGEIINQDGLFANILTYQRGFSTFLLSGRAFVFDENNKHSIYVTGGIGYMNHKIHIQIQEDIIPQLNDEYKKGYDRLSGGISVKLNLNYIHFSKKNNVKFFSGVELLKGWTKELRPYFFDEKQYSSPDLRNDILFGIKAGIIIPISKKTSSEYHYF